MDTKVYVSLGFHINFYHSWRGDMPDEAGFGTDIRVVRQVLQILNRANRAGLKARAYWDMEVYWTFQKILPEHAPDIIAAIRQRVEAGLDEIVLGPFNNGANHAATADEFRAAVAWSIENEWGSGLRQIFGKVAPLYRPQETMFTTGQEAILKECGMDGILFYYAGVPFNTYSNFIPRLDDEQRYNSLWFRSRDDQPSLILLNCIAAGDLIEQVSLESLMLDLHRKQRRGEIQSDVLININEDADLETWLPVIKWFPNLGGLEEFIAIVNKYPWADFALPSEYLASHPPKDEILVRQDLADGAFDGNYSWAEKCSSLRAWTLLEQSRLASYRAEVLAKRGGLDFASQLWNGTDSSFFQRLIGLSTTHFGMSTPIINEERQEKAYAILDRARQLAEEAERQAARALLTPGSALYDLELYQTPPARDQTPKPALVAANLPVLLPAGVNSIRVEDEAGCPVRASLTDADSFPDGRTSARVRFVADFRPADRFRIRIQASSGASSVPSLRGLKNEWLDVEFSETHGIASFSYAGNRIGDANFLAPFVTYGKRTFRAAGYEFLPLTGETWDRLQRVRLKTRVPMRTSWGEFASEFLYTFTLFDDLPYLLVDVEAHYAYTPPHQTIHNLTQKLRRLMDLHWVEVAPFQLTPALTAPALKPFHVWKHNYMGITSFYDLNYGQINPKNRDLDSFNHQVTAGWVAVSNGTLGLLVGENAQKLASMAFCPMRLREREGLQIISLNPFGSYYGEQFDYSHLGGDGNGSAIMQAFSGALQPNGPSYNGESLSFSLLLAPYAGDQPPQALQNAAAAHFYPPGAIVHSVPSGMEAVTLVDVERKIIDEFRRAGLASDTQLEPPTAFLANPSPGGVDLVWDPPRAVPVTGYEISWKHAAESGWQRIQAENCSRYHLDGLANGKPTQFKIRSLRGASCSDWSPLQTCTPGTVKKSSVLSMLGTIPISPLAKVILSSAWSLLRTRLKNW